MNIRNCIIGLLLAVLLSSCGTEIKLASKFVGSAKPRAAVYFPEEAQVTYIPDADGNYPNMLDSLDQNAFLDIMYAAYAKEMKVYGVEVYIPEDQDNVPVDSLNWLVVLSKVEIQGLYTDYVDRLFNFFDDYEYTVSLNTVNVAAWFDCNDGQWLPTQFDEYNLMEDFDSYLTKVDADKMEYHYDITPLKMKDIYDYAVFLGKRYAGFTYNYMMNRYIESEMGKNQKTPRFKLRWDPSEDGLFFMEPEEGFLELKTEN